LGHRILGSHPYSTDLDLSWLPTDQPNGVIRALMISADRDLVAEEMPALHRKFGAIVADWESTVRSFVDGSQELILSGFTATDCLTGPLPLSRFYGVGGRKMRCLPGDDDQFAVWT
jgi:hypothetical protein